MNLGLGTLTELKTHLLASSLVAGTDYDVPITNLGLGVSAMFEKRCGRLFARTVGDTHEFGAERAHVVLPRYPVEEITTIELRSTMTDGWVDQGTVNDLVEQLLTASGVVLFGTPLGTSSERVRITFTGGYWFDATADSSDTLPTGATERPDDLFLAWLLQCESLWAQRDKLGTSVEEKPASAAALGLAEIVPPVMEILRSYVRMTLT